MRANFNNKNAALTNAVSIEEETSTLLSRSDDPAIIVSEDIKNLLDGILTDFEKQVIELRLLDKSYAQIALSLDCSEKAVDNALQRIRKKIRSVI